MLFRKATKIVVISLIFLFFIDLGCSKSKKEGPSFEKGGTYLKWILKSSGEKVLTVELKKVETTYPLFPSAVGNYAVVASYKGKKTAVFPFQFPAVIHSEIINEQGHRVSMDQPLTGDRTAVVWIPMAQPFDKLSVINPKGATLLEETKFSGPKTSGFFGCDLIPERPTFYDHIQALAPEDYARLPAQMQALVEEILDPQTLLGLEDILNEL